MVTGFKLEKMETDYFDIPETKKILLSYVLKFEHGIELHVEPFGSIADAFEFLENHELKRWIILHKTTEVN